MIYHIYANRSNIGDWLSAKGIQKLLYPLPIQECLCDTPFIKETMDVLNKATEDDLIIIGGGGLLMSYFVPFWRSFQSIIDRTPFIIWGVGCCDLKNESTLPPVYLIEKIIKKSKLCIVRDELTRSYLKNCDIPDPIHCPSINYIMPLLQKGNDILHVNNYTTAGEKAYLAMRKHAQDYASNNNLIFRETNNRIEKNSEEELAQVLLRYHKSKFVLSSALHGCVIGLAMGLKVLAVSGDRKIESFMNAVNLGDWLLNNNDTNLIPEFIKKLSTQNSIEGEMQRIRERNMEVANLIYKTYEAQISTLIKN